VTAPHTWIEIAADWSDTEAADNELFQVRFGIRPRTHTVRVDEAEVLRIGQEFFGDLLQAFVRAGGRIHIHTTAVFGAIHHWPRLATAEGEVNSVLGIILAPREASPYPMVAWLEPSNLRRTDEIDEDDLQAAAGDMELLHDLIGAGFLRLFIDEEWADLLANPADRHWIRKWIEQAATASKVVTTRFDI